MCSYQKKESILKFTTKNERRNIGKPQHWCVFIGYYISINLTQWEKKSLLRRLMQDQRNPTMVGDLKYPGIEEYYQAFVNMGFQSLIWALNISFV